MLEVQKYQSEHTMLKAPPLQTLEAASLMALADAASIAAVMGSGTRLDTADSQQAKAAESSTAKLQFTAHCGMARTKSVFSLLPKLSCEDSCRSSTVASEGTLSELEDGCSSETSWGALDTFGRDLQGFQDAIETEHEPLHFDGELRKTLEPHLRKARLAREQSRCRFKAGEEVMAIGAFMGVPYTALRAERPFLFDESSYPMHHVLAKVLNVSDLSMLHEQPGCSRMETGTTYALAPLLDRERRRSFHALYDNFVTTFCIPLLHSLAIAKGVIHSSSCTDNVTYRYQAFPTIQVVPPYTSSQPPTCDVSSGHSVAVLTFYIPLTPSSGSNAVYTESFPGREDWHPLPAKSYGLGYVLDGARCLRFAPVNVTSQTRVALLFRMMLYSNQDESLCPAVELHDAYSGTGTYYDEAIIDVHRTVIMPSMDIVTKRHGRKTLLEPDARVGVPFDTNDRP